MVMLTKICVHDVQTRLRYPYGQSCSTVADVEISTVLSGKDVMACQTRFSSVQYVQRAMPVLIITDYQ
jgi:hypothetical protein